MKLKFNIKVLKGKIFAFHLVNIKRIDGRKKMYQSSFIIKNMTVTENGFTLMINFKY